MLRHVALLNLCDVVGRDQMRIREFAEVELSSSFGGIISFVKTTEQQLARDPGSVRVDEGELIKCGTPFVPIRSSILKIGPWCHERV